MSNINSVNTNPAITLVDAQRGMAIRCFQGEKDLINGQLKTLLEKCFDTTTNGEKVSKNINFIYTSNNGIRVISIPLIAFLGSNFITTENFKVETKYSLSTTNTTNYKLDSTDTTKKTFGTNMELNVGGAWGMTSANVKSINTLTNKSDNTIVTDTKKSSEIKNLITIDTVIEFERKKDSFLDDIISALSTTTFDN